MKKYLLGIVGALALTASGPAGAADMALKAPALAAPTFNWNRCYIGGHVGWGWGKDTNDFGNAVKSDPNEVFEPLLTPPSPEFGPFDHNTSGGVIGGQAGCNAQWAANWLVGIEGEVFWSGIKGSATALEDLTDPGTFTRFESRNLWDVDLAVRLGMLFNANQDLLYVKAGGVVGGFRYTETHDDFPTTHACALIAGPGVGTCSQTLNQTVPGFLVGVGWEHVLSIPHWTFKAEYDFIGYPSHNVAYPDAAATMSTFGVKDAKSILKAGVNFYF